MFDIFCDILLRDITLYNLDGLNFNHHIHISILQQIVKLLIKIRYDIIRSSFKYYLCFA